MVTEVDTVRGEVSDVETLTTLPDLDDLAEIVNDQCLLSVKVSMIAQVS